MGPECNWVGKKGFLGHVHGRGRHLGSAHTVDASRRVEPLRMPVATPRRSSGCGGSPRARASQPSLAWQLNEVYRQITGAHSLQQTKFRWVLGAQGGVGGWCCPHR